MEQGTQKLSLKKKNAFWKTEYDNLGGLKLQRMFDRDETGEVEDRWTRTPVRNEPGGGEQKIGRVVAKIIGPEVKSSIRQQPARCQQSRLEEKDLAEKSHPVWMTRIIQDGQESSDRFESANKLVSTFFFSN